MGLKPAWDDLSVGIAVVLLAAVVSWQTAVIPDNAIYARVGPKIIPWIATVMLGLLGLALAVQGLRGGWPHDQDRPEYASLAWLVLGLVLNVAVIDVAGFIIASTVLFLMTARAFGSRQPVRDAAIGFALALIAYVGFDRMLGYKIGAGLIEGLI